jgi:hypothetical protein
LSIYGIVNDWPYKQVSIDYKENKKVNQILFSTIIATAIVVEGTTGNAQSVNAGSSW